MQNYPNIQKREYKSGRVRYCVRIQSKKQFKLHITFQTEEDARDWLNENYYEYVKNPNKFKDIHKKKW
jgi:hypothetical protein